MNTINDSNSFNSSSNNRHNVADTRTEIQRIRTSHQAMFLLNTEQQAGPGHSLPRPVLLRVLTAGGTDSQAAPGNWTEREGASEERGDTIQAAAQAQTERVALKDMQGL